MGNRVKGVRRSWTWASALAAILLSATPTVPAQETTQAATGAASLGATAPAPGKSATAARRRNGIAPILSIILDGSGGTPSAPAARPPVINSIPGQTSVLGSAATLELESYVTATDGDAVTSFSLASGSLPPGLSFNGWTGRIDGIATAPGTYDITVTANDKDGTSNRQTVRFAISAPTGAVPPVMSAVPAQRGTLNQVISPLGLAAYVIATNGDSITGYSLVGGELPPGVTLNLTTGEISGTPSSGGKFGALVAATDKDGASNAVLVWFSILDPAQQIAADMSNVPTSMTFDERTVALDRVSAYITSNWGSLNLANDKLPLVSYISSLADFADAGVGPDGNVWARFKDGTPTAFMFNSADRRAATPAGAVPSRALSFPMAAASGISPVEAAAPGAPVGGGSITFDTGNMPKGTRRAVLIEVDNSGLGFIDTLAPWLTLAGYTDVQKPVPTIANLMKSIKRAGILHFSTHGAYAVARGGTKEYSLAVERVVPRKDEPDPQRIALFEIMEKVGHAYRGPHYKYGTDENGKETRVCSQSIEPGHAICKRGRIIRSQSMT